MKRLLGVVLAGVFLAGCGTSVPLNDVPVADATATPVGAGATGSASGVGSGGVAPVDLGQSGAQISPASAKRIIYFDHDSFVIRPEYQALIAENARLIKAQASRRVAIEGHTDETGGREYNLALGQKRAEAVAGALRILGVPANQMEAVSFGKEKPAALGKDEAAYSQNRRAEIRYQ